MSATLINLIIQLIAGAIGGNAAGATVKNLDLGALGNTIAGAARAAGRFSLRCCRCFRGLRVVSISANCSARRWVEALPVPSSLLLSALSKIRSAGEFNHIKTGGATRRQFQTGIANRLKCSNNLCSLSGRIVRADIV